MHANVFKTRVRCYTEENGSSSKRTKIEKNNS